MTHHQLDSNRKFNNLEDIGKNFKDIKKKYFGDFKKIWFEDLLIIGSSTGIIIKEGKEKGRHLTGPFIRILNEKHIAICVHLSEERNGKNVKIPIKNKEGREIGEELQIIFNLDKIEKIKDEEDEEIEESVNRLFRFITESSRLLNEAEILEIGDKYILLKDLSSENLEVLIIPKKKKEGEIDINKYLKFLEEQIITPENLPKRGWAYVVQIKPKFKLVGIIWVMPQSPLLFLFPFERIEKAFESFFKELLKTLEEKGFITVKPPLTQWL